MSLHTLKSFVASLFDSELHSAEATDKFRKAVSVHFGGDEAAAMAVAAMFFEVAAGDFGGPGCQAWLEAERLGQAAAGLNESLPT